MAPWTCFMLAVYAGKVQIKMLNAVNAWKEEETCCDVHLKDDISSWSSIQTTNMRLNEPMQQFTKIDTKGKLARLSFSSLLPGSDVLRVHSEKSEKINSGKGSSGSKKRRVKKNVLKMALSQISSHSKQHSHCFIVWDSSCRAKVPLIMTAVFMILTSSVTMKGCNSLTWMTLIP